MRDLPELNLNSGGRPVTRPAPSSEQLSFIEQIVGANLPAEYRAFLMFSNGGHPELSTFRQSFDGVDYLWGIDKFLHVASTDIKTVDVGDVLWRYAHRWPNSPRELLPIAVDGGDNMFCLDLTEAGAGRIVMQVYDEPNPLLIFLAASFSDFVDGLFLDPDDE